MIYGSLDYWNDRYLREENNPFDWLFDYNDVASIIGQLIDPRDSDELILLPGCGNAMFSSELHDIGGYKNLLNFDNSMVVINQMRERFPSMRWEVMDVLSLDIDDKSVPYVIDKSLIDTLLCYKDG